MNIHNFSTRLKNTYTFRLMVYGYSLVSSLFLRSNNRISIVANLILANYLSKIIEGGKSNISYIMKSSEKNIVSLSINHVISYTISSIEKFESIIGFNIGISTALKGIIKISVPIVINNGMVTNATVGHFYSLSDYDPNALSTMDTETLGDLDFVVV